MKTTITILCIAAALFLTRCRQSIQTNNNDMRQQFETYSLFDMKGIHPVISAPEYPYVTEDSSSSGLSLKLAIMNDQQLELHLRRTGDRYFSIEKYRSEEGQETRLTLYTPSDRLIHTYVTVQSPGEQTNFMKSYATEEHRGDRIVRNTWFYAQEYEVDPPAIEVIDDLKERIPDFEPIVKWEYVYQLYPDLTRLRRRHLDAVSNEVMLDTTQCFAIAPEEYFWLDFIFGYKEVDCE